MTTPSPKRRKTRASVKASALHPSPAENSPFTKIIPSIEETPVTDQVLPTKDIVPLEEDLSDEDEVPQDHSISQIVTLQLPTPDTIARPIHLSSIPAELLLKIHRLIGAIASTCLGLTSKQFYRQHLTEWGPKVPLRLPMSITANEWVMQLMLHNYLKNWMAAAGLVWNFDSGKFVTKQRMEELKKARELDRSYEWGRW